MRLPPAGTVTSSPTIALIRCVLIAAAGVVLTGLAAAAAKRWPGRPRGGRLAWRKAGRWLVAGAMVLYVLTFGAMGVLQHRGHNVCYVDTGIFDEVMWNSVHGRFWHTSALPCAPGRHANYDHAAFALWLLLPAYWAVPRMETLIVAGAIAVALGAVPVYLLARRELKLPGAAACIAIAYLLYPPAQFINLDAAFNAFRPVSLGVAPVLAGLYFARGRRLGWAAVFFGLGLLSKEEMAVPLAVAGLYLAARRGSRRLGVGLTVASAVWLWLSLCVLIPYWRGGRAAYLDAYSHWGSTPAEAVATMARDPGRLASALGGPCKLAYLADLLAPLGGVPLAAPGACALMLPTYVYSALSRRPAQCSIFFHYAAAMVPFVFFAAVLGIRGLARLWSRRSRGVVWLATFVLVTSVLGNIAMSRSPISTAFLSRGPFGPDLYRSTERDRMVDRAIARLPIQASVSATRFLASHLTRHRAIAVFPAQWETADYIVLDLQERWTDRGRIEPALAAVRRSPGHVVLHDADGFFLAQRLE